MLERLYTRSQCQELERIAIEEFAIPGFELMQRAGRAAFAELLDRWPQARSLSICCGKGNNAGDGYIVAGLALGVGLRIELVQLGGAAALSGDAALARDWALGEGVVPIEPRGITLSGDVVVDALLGTGLRGGLRDPYAKMVRGINESPAPVLAIDIPTGVDADTGACAQPSVVADVTVTFIGRKRGLYTGPGVSAVGHVVYADLGVGREILDLVPGTGLLNLEHLLSSNPLPSRDLNAYKQTLGHVVVVGGDHAMGGAPLMAAEAALRVGAGMVSVVTRAIHRPAILSRRPELMVVDADDTQARDEVLARATTLVVGPGLGRRPWGYELIRAALSMAKPMVLDADGLNVFADLSSTAPLTVSGPIVVTPHTGEAATLLDCSSSSVHDDRFAAACALADLLAGVAVLKGAGTVIASHETAGSEILGVCAHGNPGMATAGMGDILAGVIGGMLAQGLCIEDAAVFGVCLHSCAGDAAANQIGERSLLATDLLPQLMALLKNS
jgi:NAD(P)H-hydrate epimerase